MTGYGQMASFRSKILFEQLYRRDVLKSYRMTIKKKVLISVKVKGGCSSLVEVTGHAIKISCHSRFFSWRFMGYKH